jgi:hypothetical protein
MKMKMRTRIMTKITKMKTKKSNRKVKSKKKKIQNNDEEESKPQRPRLAIELRALGTTPTESESVNTIDETPRKVYSAITSDPGVSSTFEEAFLDP